MEWFPSYRLLAFDKLTLALVKDFGLSLNFGCLLDVEDAPLTKGKAGKVKAITQNIRLKQEALATPPPYRKDWRMSVDYMENTIHYDGAAFTFTVGTRILAQDQAGNFTAIGQTATPTGNAFYYDRRVGK